MQENNKSNWFTPFSYAIVLIIGLGIGLFFKGNFSLQSLKMNGASPIQEILDLVKTKYVEKINEDSLDMQLANYYLAQLDPHSVYIAPSELTDVNEQLMSNFKGIGIEFLQYRDSIFVSHVMKGGPAEKAGLAVGDILLKADDTIQLSGKKWEADQIRAKIKGPDNTKVKLKILSGKTTKELVITRGNVAVSSVDASYQIKPGVGYILSLIHI